MYSGQESSTQLQLQKTYANRKSTSKSRKHLHQFDSRCCKCSQHKQIKNFICSAFLCLVVLWVFAARVLSNWWSCFLNLQAFFSICSMLSSLGHRRNSFLWARNILSRSSFCLIQYFLEGVCWCLTVCPCWLMLNYNICGGKAYFSIAGHLINPTVSYLIHGFPLKAPKL